jgi:hypothetical protein
LVNHLKGISRGMPSSSTSRTVLVWHVHGSWTEALVAGRHTYVLPFTAPDDPFGRGLSGRQWPNAREASAAELADHEVDVVILQRPEEIELTTAWLGKRPGMDVPAVYVEHNAPRPSPVDSVHPVAERTDIPLVHVTDFNRLMWDSGCAPTRVITHGVSDPGPLYSGDMHCAATMINEPVRRWRTVGADLLAPLSRHIRIDAWGIGTEELNSAAHHSHRVVGHGDLPRPELMAAVARRRVYLHTARWTSLGLSLIEAMLLGMPVVAVAATMAPLEIPVEAGVVTADVDVLGRAASAFLADHGAAAAAGKAARQHATARFGLDRFLREWDRLIEEVCNE